jgi:hypothetical protein
MHLSSNGSSSRVSTKIQFWALALTALADIGPIGIQLLKNYRPNLLPPLDSGLIAAMCVGTAAALLGLDSIGVVQQLDEECAHSKFNDQTAPRVSDGLGRPCRRR